MSHHKPTNHLLTSNEIATFCAMIWDYFAVHRRLFPWRYLDDPYAILVSEIMLQQTQTHRVVGKFEQFLATFPHFDSLANAPLHDLLKCWQGLGYNRRALYLQKIAQQVMHDHNGQLPRDPALLQTFPGLGTATAASVTVFAFNEPHVFIETNIRTVFIHTFFPMHAPVTDRMLMPLVEQTIDVHAPRDWYYALMDYGVMLKKNNPNPNRKSAHYSRQSKFEGSDRQLRGAIVRYLVTHHVTSPNDLLHELKTENDRLDRIVSGLCADGLVKKDGGQIMLS